MLGHSLLPLLCMFHPLPSTFHMTSQICLGLSSHPHITHPLLLRLPLFCSGAVASAPQLASSCQLCTFHSFNMFFTLYTAARVIVLKYKSDRILAIPIPLPHPKTTQWLPGAFRIKKNSFNSLLGSAELGHHLSFQLYQVHLPCLILSTHCCGPSFGPT